jgi:uncharacterized protein with HEPN domain
LSEIKINIKNTEFKKYKKYKNLKKSILYDLIIIGEASGVLLKKYNFKNNEILLF